MLFLMYGRERSTAYSFFFSNAIESWNSPTIGEVDELDKDNPSLLGIRDNNGKLELDMLIDLRRMMLWPLPRLLRSSYKLF